MALFHTPHLCNTVKGDEVYTGPTLVSLQGRRIPHLTWLHSCPIGEFHLTSYRLLPQPALGPDAT